MILYGAPVKEEIKRELIERIKKLGKKPVLAIIQVGDREDSNIYIKQKQKFAEEIGVDIILERFELDANIRMNSNDTNGGRKIIEEVKKLNKDESIDGIMVQLPLLGGFDTEKILNAIDPKKDADGLREKSKIIPATARAVISLLDYYKIPVEDKMIAVIGQSILAGKPISQELEKKGGKIFRCDINTENVPGITKKCHVLISAVGQAGLVTKEFVNEGQTVVDVGINMTSSPAPLLDTEEGKGKTSKLVGDVKFEEVEPLVSAITPVPGGVGPLTVACLFLNLLDLCYDSS